MLIRFLVESHYASVRRDPVFWWPYVEPVLARLGIAAPEFRPDMADGTNAIFWLDSERLIKIYTPFYGGRGQEGLEVLAYRFLMAEGNVPVARMLAKGELEPKSSDWKWPFAIFQRCPGNKWSVGQDQMVGKLGSVLNRLHNSGPWSDFSKTWGEKQPGGFEGFLQRQRNRFLEIAPTSIWRQEIESLNLNQLARAWPVLLHGDIEPDHVYVESGEISGLIDFGDAKLGDPVYDLVTIGRLFVQRSAASARAFESQYGSEVFSRADFCWRLGAYQALHEWNTADDIADMEAASRASNLEELGRFYWPETL